jgi:hypothetical protein
LQCKKRVQMEDPTWAMLAQRSGVLAGAAHYLNEFIWSPSSSQWHHSRPVCFRQVPSRHTRLFIASGLFSMPSSPCFVHDLPHFPKHHTVAATMPAPKEVGATIQATPLITFRTPSHQRLQQVTQSRRILHSARAARRYICQHNLRYAVEH